MSYFGQGKTGDVPDGNYDVEIIESSAFRGRDDAEYAKCVLRIEHGPLTGHLFDHFMNLGHPGLREKAGESLAMYGISIDAVESFDDLVPVMPQLQGVRANVTLARNRNGYQEARVNTVQAPLAQQAEPQQARATTKSAFGDDIPF